MIELWDFWDWNNSPLDYLSVFFPDDVEDLEEESDWRRAFLARYGRQSMLQWDDVTVIEMNRLLDQLIGIMKKESSLSRMSED